MKNIPILLGVIISKGKQIKVWCPFCNKYHIHGMDSSLSAGKKSHRVAHCFNSIFNTTDYYIKVQK